MITTVILDKVLNYAFFALVLGGLIGVVRAIVKAATDDTTPCAPPEPKVGSIWVKKDPTMTPWGQIGESGKRVEILDVREGWVLYGFNPPQLHYNPYCLSLEGFTQVYQPIVEVPKVWTDSRNTISQESQSKPENLTGAGSTTSSSLTAPPHE